MRLMRGISASDLYSNSPGFGDRGKGLEIDVEY